MNTRKFNSQKGITLVALIITIIVLLILAMVSIRLVMNGGIIDRANRGVNAYNDAEVKEKIQLAHSELEMAKFTNSSLDEIAFLTERLEAQGLTGATVEATSDGWNITYNGKAYPLSASGTVGDAVAVIDWDTVIANAQKHPDQSSTNDEIGIDMYGNPVNMDLWELTFNEEEKTCETGKQMGSKRSVGYKGDIVEGKIVGEIPQYIKKDNETYTLTSLYFAFGDLETLTSSPSIPGTVTNLRETFSWCKSLTTAPTIPNSVTNMNYAFTWCTSLTEAPTIPSSVINMNNTFTWCTSLTEAPTIPNSVTDMHGTFSSCTSLVTAPVISNTVTSMIQTFSGCTSLTQAPIIPNSVIKMGGDNEEGTFWRCTALTKAPEIPNSVTDMRGTFHDCTALTTAPTIPSSVTQMKYTFLGCTSLTGNLIINASDIAVYPYSGADYDCLGCLKNAATNDGCNLVVSGTCPQLDAIIATKSENSHITKGQ